MDAAAFRDGMRRLAAGVCLISTAARDGERYGLTATAVCSLSMEPPLLLCCLNRSSHSFAAVRDGGRFCVNALGADQTDVAHHFAGDRSGAEKFTVGDWTAGATGAPVLTGALAAFDCALHEVVEAGTHAIVIGVVREVRVSEVGRAPLLYAQGGYGAFTAADALAALTGG